MTAKRAESVTRETLRKALRSWHRSGQLGANPLAQLRIVAAARRAAGLDDTPAGFGAALRRVLQEAIDCLKPHEGDPQFTEKRWRPYLVLSEHYIQGRARAYLAQQMHIAPSTYDHTLATALDRLLEQLQEWEEGGLARGQPGALKGIRGEPQIPFMAPPRLPGGLVGRDALLEALRDRLLEDGDPPTLALHGLPGVGKTSLAVELSHHPDVAGRYRDGVLWAGLGPDPEPSVQLHLWEIALGFSAEELGDLSGSDRARALHACIGLRKLILVLDDIWQVDHLRTLKVGGPNCAMIITTRFPGIARELADDGAVQVTELGEAASLEVLGRLVPQLKARLKSRAEEIVEAVGGLPLALQLVGRSLRQDAYAGRPQRLIEALDRLGDAGARLRVRGHRFAVDQPPGALSQQVYSLEAAIAVSEQALDQGARAALRSLSVFPPKPNSFGEGAARAVTGQPIDTLDRLVDAGLMEMGGPDRYMVHRTISDYAALQHKDEAPMKRLATYALAFIGEHGEDFPNLDREVQNVLAGLEFAHAHATGAEFVRGVNSLFPYLEASGLTEQARLHLLRASESAEGAGQMADLTQALVNLGRCAQRDADYPEAIQRFTMGLRLAKGLGDLELECACHQGLGAAAFSQGDFQGAREQYGRALALAEASDLPRRQAAVLSNMGMLAAATGEVRTAQEHFTQALALARTRTRDHALLSAILTNLGVLAAQSGEFARAAECFEESLSLARSAGNRRAMTFLLSNMGALAHDQGHDERARRSFEEALELARQTGDRVQLSSILANLAALATSRGDLDEARSFLAEGFDLAQAHGHSENLILLNINRGLLQEELGELDEARASLDTALSLANEAGRSRYLCIIHASLGGLHLKLGDPRAAEAEFQAALESAESLGSVELRADAKFGLAGVAEHRGQPERAVRLGEDALALYASIGHHKADDLKAWLIEVKQGR